METSKGKTIKSVSKEFLKGCGININSDKILVRGSSWRWVNALSQEKVQANISTLWT